jgi:purine-cytosine permease-like protein
MDKEKQYLFDKPRNVKVLLLGLLAILVLLFIADFFVIKHPHFTWEEWPEFYAVFGFAAYASIVILAKYILRPILKREEDYYD